MIEQHDEHARSGPADRRVERVTITGDLPFGPDGFRSEPLRGELFG